jgi:hypothetical protein
MDRADGGDPHAGSPADGVTIGVARVDVEVWIVDAAVRVVNIDWFRCDVQVTEPNGRLHRIEFLGEMAAYAVKPFQLEGVFVGPDSESLRDIGVDDRKASDYSFKDSDIFAVRPRRTGRALRIGVRDG